MTVGSSATQTAEVLPRLDAESIVVTALRDVMKTAFRRQVSYPEAMAEGARLFPDLLSSEKSILFREMEKPAIRAFRQKAAAASKKENREVAPKEILQREIKELSDLISFSNGNSKDMARELETLHDHLSYFSRSAESEHSILYADVFQQDRPILPSPGVSFARGKEYSLGKGRHLHLRMLHPDKAEHVSGADIVYEVCSPEIKQGRIAFVQYKLWDYERIPWSKIKTSQLSRMKNCLCDTELCRQFAKGNKSCFRLPYCSAFLRLTQKMQNPESRLISAGYFVPICRLPLIQRGSLDFKDISGRSLSSDLFEAAFVEGLVGSDWIPYASIESLYRRTKIFESHDRILIHAQEY